MAAVLWGRSGTREVDDDGVPISGAKAYFFDPSTTTPRTVYQDGALATPHTHPVVASSGGRFPAVYLPSGSYKVRVTLALGSTIYEYDEIAPSEQIDTDANAVDEHALLSTGDVWWSPVNAARSGAVRLNAQSIGSAASGATQRANADCEALFAFLWNNLTDAFCPVSGGRGASAAADWAANKTLTVPGMRHRTPFGLGSMGGSAVNLIDPAYITTGGVNTPGSFGGEDAHVLVTAEMPAHTHVYRKPVTSGGDTMVFDNGTTRGYNEGELTGSAGSNTEHNNMPPFVLGTWYMKL